MKYLHRAILFYLFTAPLPYLIWIASDIRLTHDDTLWWCILGYMTPVLILVAMFENVSRGIGFTGYAFIYLALLSATVGFRRYLKATRSAYLAGLHAEPIKPASE